MKTRFSLIYLAIVSLLGISLCISCDKKDETKGVVTYKGIVVYDKTTTPFPDLEVKLTDGNNVSATTKTNAEGAFSFKVDLSTINGDYYFLVGDATCIQKKVNIPGWGQTEIDLGIIEIEGPTIPVVEMDTVLAVATSSATFKGHVVSDGRHAVTERGFCYAKTDYPTIDNNRKVSGKGIGEFMSSVSDLESNTTYYVCAYATNEMGTAYSRTIKFTTSNGLPAVTTVSVTDVTAKSAICNADVTSDGGFGITACGVCWSATSATPTIADAHSLEVARLGVFTSQIINLTASTTYYVRAYASNEKGTAYGDVKTFTTTDGLPAVTTVSVTNITAKSAVCNVNITSNGGYNITACGVCWSATSATPTIADKHTSEVVRSGEFAANVTNLSASTTYYVRAYATNENGTSYGDTKTFTTTDGLPAITTVSVTNITAKSAVCNANITSNGGYNITACGVCWSAISATPTIADAHTSEVVHSGAFAANVTNLSASTTYYIRAYATNENGTSYGDTKTFTTTQGLPTVTTTDPGENITSTSIATGGNVTDDGGFTVTARGVVYGTLPYPTLENASKVSSGSGTGYFSANITNISPENNTYYIRAYATNSNGTAYGEQITITPERSEYLSLPIVEYGGYRYHVYKDMGSMDWQSAVKLCDDLTFAGYNDWFLPDQYELRAIGEALIKGWHMDKDSRGPWNNSTSSYWFIEYYWSSSKISTTYAMSVSIISYSAWKEEENTGHWYGQLSENISQSKRVRPVRKDKIE